MFSSRVPSALAPNRLAEALARCRTEGRPYIDLTDSNPTRAGLAYPENLLAILGEARGLVYYPAPLGLRAAREAVSRDYARRGVAVPVDHIALTSSSSESYSLLFKLLCDPGDEVLVPRPSYPLFEHLTMLEGVVARSYELESQGSWTIDLASLQDGMNARTRAVLLVSPNNPTGSFVRAAELDVIAGECARAAVPIIADEVFADYELADGAGSEAARPLARNDVLVFALGGLSKSVGLPQVKLGWVAVGGPGPLVNEALSRLELVCDTYLSVSTPVQRAAGEFLEAGATVRHQIQGRIRHNLGVLMARVSGQSQLRMLAAEGGWSAILQVPGLQSEEDLVLDLLEGDGVLVHPGYFFDFPREAYLVMSLLPPPHVFEDGVSRVLRHFDCTAAQCRDRQRI
jgi:aspartate/methionine/tyrosine aminotransferase